MRQLRYSSRQLIIPNVTFGINRRLDSQTRRTCKSRSDTSADESGGPGKPVGSLDHGRLSWTQPVGVNIVGLSYCLVSLFDFCDAAALIFSTAFYLLKQVALSFVGTSCRFAE